MKKIFLTMICMCMVLLNYAQSKEVTGIVTDQATGETIPGVNVVVKGTTNGTVTDFNGKYSIEVSQSNATLLFSFVGYAPQEINYTGQSTIDVVLAVDALKVNEVVVTALGIKREKKSLGYSVSEVKGDDVARSGDGNVLNALSGKAAGVVVNTTAGSSMGSSNIVLRGYNTLRGGEALIVVDGIPYSNRSTLDGGYDYGSGISDLNMDDVESVSILKGANAAALYGSLAMNGVVIITTKSGKKNHSSVSVSSTYTMSEVGFMPELQNTYGEGYYKNIGHLDAGDDGILETRYGSTKSWGPKMEGQDVRISWLRDKPVLPYSKQEDNVKDFFRKGHTFKNSVNITNGNDKRSWSLSLMSENMKDIIRTSEMDKYNMGLRVKRDVNSWFDIDGKINFTYKSAYNRPENTDKRGGFMGLMVAPRSFRNDLMSPAIYTPNGKSYSGETFQDGAPIQWDDEIGSWGAGNPYWDLYVNYNKDRQTRVNGFTKLNFKLAKGLSAFTRLGVDYSNLEARKFEEINSGAYREKGGLSSKSNNHLDINADFLFTYDKDMGDFHLTANAGGNHSYSRSHYLWATGNEAVLPGADYMGNYKSRDGGDDTQEREKNSLYGSFQLAYRNYLFLDVTGRNDWTSTLSDDNNSFFYPSASIGFVVTDAFDIKSSVLDYAKVRLSASEVGNDFDIYAIKQYITMSADIVGRPIVNMPKKLSNLNLKPEMNRSLEFGLDLRFLKNRIGLDLAVYQNNIKDQILNTPLTISSGYNETPINAGEIENKGVELSLNVKPIRTKDLLWDMTFNYSKNEMKVVSLNDGLEEIEMRKPRNARIIAKVGEKYGQIVGRTFARNEDGLIMLNDKNFPIVPEDLSVVGNIQPDFTASIQNTLRYKNLTLGFLITSSFGNDVVTYKRLEMNYNGTSKESVAGREGWMAAKDAGEASAYGYSSSYGGLDYLVGRSIREDGSLNTASNPTYINPARFWKSQRSSRNAEYAVEDGSYVKMKEISLNYRLPKSFLAKLPFESLSVGFVARNPWIIHKKTDFFDPEAFQSNTQFGSYGVENAAWPNRRTYSFNVSFKF